MTKIENNLLYTFKDPSLLDEAITHRSYSNESRQSKGRNNERLEFLGDSVLELVVSDILVKTYPGKDEGELTRARSLLVREEMLVKLAKELELGLFIKLGKGEKLSAGRNKASILSAALEALIAAIYLDGGLMKAYEFISRLWSKYLEAIFSDDLDTDYKTRLQEYLQSRHEKLPLYELSKSMGPAHSRRFEVSISNISDLNLRAVASSKKQAEQLVAHKAYHLLTEGGKQ